MNNNIEIVDIDFLNEDDIPNREIIVTLSNDSEVHICACYESFQQWNGTIDELYITLPVAEGNNEWLHGIGEMDTSLVFFN